MVLPGVGVAEHLLLGSAVVLSNGVARDTCNSGLRVGNDHAVLDVEALDLVQISAGISEELGNDGELGVGIDGLARSIEGGVTLAVRVEIASIRVGSTGVPVIGVGTATIITVADGLSNCVGGVRSQSSRNGVGLPDIQFSTARAIATETGVGAVARGFPALYIGLII